MNIPMWRSYARKQYITDTELDTIVTPTLVLAGKTDIVKVEHIKE